MSVWRHLPHWKSGQSPNVFTRHDGHTRTRFAIIRRATDSNRWCLFKGMSEPQKKSLVSAGFIWTIFCLGMVGVTMIALPNFIKSRATSCCNACVNNLRQIDAAANQFALENSKTNGEAIHYPNDLTPYIKLNSAGKIPPCPQGGTYHIAKVGEIPTCSLGTTVTPSHVLP